METRRELDARARAHVAACPACRELLADGAALGRMLATLRHRDLTVSEADLPCKLGRDFERERGALGHLRALTSGQRIALALAVALFPAIVLAAQSPHKLTLERWFTAGFGLVLVAVTAVLLAPLSRPRHWGRRLVLAAVALAVPFVWAASIGTPFAHTTEETYSEWACFALGAACSAPAFAALRVLARSAPSVLELALAASVAGLAGNMALQLYCMDLRLVHLVAGHATLGLLWFAASMLLAREPNR